MRAPDSLWRLDLDEVDHLEPVCAQQPDPVPIAEMELDARLVGPFEAVSCPSQSPSHRAGRARVGIVAIYSLAKRSSARATVRVGRSLDQVPTSPPVTR